MELTSDSTLGGDKGSQAGNERSLRMLWLLKFLSAGCGQEPQA